MNAVATALSRRDALRLSGGLVVLFSSNARAAARKSAGLKAMIRRERLNGVIVGIRRDEQSTRAKERVFSPRSNQGDWDIAHQPAEFWDHYKARVAEDEHVRVHPLLGWTELDIWRYTKSEGIPVVPAYLAQDGLRCAG